MGQISVTQFSNGTVADANQVNANNNAIVNGINGNLDDTNISATANINGSKILASSLPATALANQDGWQPAGETWVYNANNGNKETPVNIAGDKTTKYSPGMKVKLPRSVTPPTQAMSFVAASSQYASKVTPTGITFTGAFTTEAWVYLNSYTNAGVITRDNVSTAGFGMQINASGQIQLYWRNATNNSNFLSYQSLPLKRWVHIAAVVTSVAAPAVTMYINGTGVPVQTVGATATTLVQGGNLQLAAQNGAAFFDGFISEARVWSVAQTQAQIQANMNINLVGNETNLVALFQGNGNYTDTTTNANTLTAVGGATFTATNPYNAIEYGIIESVTYSNPNTTLTIATGNSNIPNQTLGSPSYSLQKQPFGFPADSTFSLFVADTAAALRLLTAGINVPMDNIKYTNAGTAGGTLTISQTGTIKTMMGQTASITLTAAAQNTAGITLPIAYTTSIFAVANSVQESGTVQVQGRIVSLPTLTALTVEISATTGTNTGSVIIGWFTQGV